MFYTWYALISLTNQFHLYILGHNIVMASLKLRCLDFILLILLLIIISNEPRESPSHFLTE